MEMITVAYLCDTCWPFPPTWAIPLNKQVAFIRKDCFLAFSNKKQLTDSRTGVGVNRKREWAVN